MVLLNTKISQKNDNLKKLIQKNNKSKNNNESKKFLNPPKILITPQWFFSTHLILIQLIHFFINLLNCSLKPTFNLKKKNRLCVIINLEFWPFIFYINISVINITIFPWWKIIILSHYKSHLICALKKTNYTNEFFFK